MKSKANELVKKLGLGAARDIICGDPDLQEFKIHLPGDYWHRPSVIDANELRRLVESHDIVNQYQSLAAAKEHLQYFINWLSEDESHAEYSPEIGKFKQAIEDVESCQ